jgi:hypothetical protein
LNSEQASLSAIVDHPFRLEQVAKLEPELALLTSATLIDAMVAIRSLFTLSSYWAASSVPNQIAEAAGGFQTAQPMFITIQNLALNELFVQSTLLDNCLMADTEDQNLFGR